MKRVNLFFLILTAGAFMVVPQTISAQPALNLENPAAVQSYEKAYILANPLDMVAAPNRYLNKYVKIRAKFDKFSTLGLDYEPALRSSEDYISFLIQRSDVKDHNIPLSEMKIFMKRTEAEKHIDLDSGDEIEFCGKVFSNALGDVWMDVEKFTVLTVKAPKEKSDKSAAADNKANSDKAVSPAK